MIGRPYISTHNFMVSETLSLRAYPRYTSGERMTLTGVNSYTITIQYAGISLGFDVRDLVLHIVGAWYELRRTHVSYLVPKLEGKNYTAAGV